MDGRWYDDASKFDDQYSLLTRKLLRELSVDARASVLELSQKLNTSRKTVRDKMKGLQSELGLRYTIELNDVALGLTNPHLIRIKFGEKPDYKEVEKILSSSYIPQLVILTSGTFDMVIYANAVHKDEYVHWDKRTQIQLSKYRVSWRSSDLAHMHVGYFPVRNELIDRTDIDPVHKQMLKLLNDDSRIPLSKISKELGMHFNTVGYNFNKLLKMGYIKRFTIATNIPKNAVAMSTFVKYTLTDKYEAESVEIRKAYRSSAIQYPVASRYAVICQLIGSDWAFLMGIFDNHDMAYDHMVKKYKQTFASQQAKIEYGKIDRIMIGRLPIRSVDSSKEYSVINWADSGSPSK